MKTHPASDHLNLLLAAATVLAMATGLVLFTQFHVGHGAFATEFGGLSKWFWLNLHRAAALLVTFCMVHHLHIHARVIGRLFAVLPRLRGQTVFFALSLLVFLTGFTAWAALPHGPCQLHSLRHTVIDIHNLAGLCALTGTLLHLRRRWRRLWPGTH